MAVKKRNSAEELARLTPNSIDVKIDGQDLRVPTDKAENAVMNMIVASQMRHLLQSQIKNYKDDEVKLTPKELADLARAARDIAAFSSEVYASTPAIEPAGEKKAEKVEETDFSTLNTIEVKTEEKKDGTGNPP